MLAQILHDYLSLKEPTVNIPLLILDLKVVSATFLLVYLLSLNESTCQARKNTIYFSSKALFILEKIKF